MKVGKAIYNILSQSTDVQSNFPFNDTNYTAVGSELVTNGDFSATGSEVAVNGTFATDTDWSGSNTISGGQLTKTSADLSNQSYAGLSVAKSYKVVIDVAEKNGSDLKFYFGGTQTDINAGTQTLYLINGTSDLLIGVNQGDGSIINSISVKELGADWEFNSTAILTANGMNITTGGYIRQDVVTIGKFYKLTYDIVSYTNGDIRVYDGTDQGNIPTSLGSNTFYFKAGDSLFYIQANSVTANLVIDNISVQEVVLNKIFPELAPPDIDAPYIVYSVVSNSPSETKNTNGDIDTASIEVYGFQDTYNKAVDLGVSVRAALDRKTGTYNTIEIQSTNYVNEQMDVNEARKLWAAIQDYSIRIKNL